MKLYPVTNGTPDNSLEFYTNPGNENEECKLFTRLVGNEAAPFVTYETCAWARWTFFGPAFKALVNAAGYVEETYDPHEAVPLIHRPLDASARVGQRQPTRKRCRSAVELCAWLEQRLKEPTTPTDPSPSSHS